MAEMAGDMLWNDMANAALNAKPSSTTSKGAPLSRKERKEQEKEKERLQKEGKCLSCHGYGKTPDGKYTCPVCNGTGILQEEKKWNDPTSIRLFDNPIWQLSAKGLKIYKSLTQKELHTSFFVCDNFANPCFFVTFAAEKKDKKIVRPNLTFICFMTRLFNGRVGGGFTKNIHF